jgi:hypothetical protein
MRQQNNALFKIEISKMRLQGSAPKTHITLHSQIRQAAQNQLASTAEKLFTGE